MSHSSILYFQSSTCQTLLLSVFNMSNSSIFYFQSSTCQTLLFSIFSLQHVTLFYFLFSVLNMSNNSSNTPTCPLPELLLPHVTLFYPGLIPAELLAVSRLMCSDREKESISETGPARGERGASPGVETPHWPPYLQPSTTPRPQVIYWEGLESSTGRAWSHLLGGPWVNSQVIYWESSTRRALSHLLVEPWVIYWEGLESFTGRALSHILVGPWVIYWEGLELTHRLSTGSHLLGQPWVIYW